MESPELSQPLRDQLVQRLHDSPVMLVAAITGGGNAFITDLLNVAGASRTVLEVIVPYSDAARTDLLALDRRYSADDSGAVSTATGEALARACFSRAQSLAADNPGAVLAGVACTATLVTDRPKVGKHRAHLAICSSRGTISTPVNLPKGMHDRVTEDRLVADALLRALVDHIESAPS